MNENVTTVDLGRVNGTEVPRDWGDVGTAHEDHGEALEIDRQNERRKRVGGESTCVTCDIHQRVGAPVGVEVGEDRIAEERDVQSSAIYGCRMTDTVHEWECELGLPRFIVARSLRERRVREVERIDIRLHALHRECGLGRADAVADSVGDLVGDVDDDECFHGLRELPDGRRRHATVLHRLFDPWLAAGQAGCGGFRLHVLVIEDQGAGEDSAIVGSEACRQRLAKFLAGRDDVSSSTCAPLASTERM